MSLPIPPALEEFFSALLKGRIVDDDLQLVGMPEVLAELMKTTETSVAAGMTPETGYGCPIRLQWEITNRCNLHCAFCYNSDDRAGHQALAPEVSLSLARQIVNTNVLEVVLTGGEILSDWELSRDVARILSGGGVGLHLITNGWFLDDEKIREMKNWNLLSVQVSIDGADATVHDEMRGRPGSWKRAVTGVRRLVEAGIFTVVGCVLTRRNWRSLEDFIEFCLLLGVRRLLIGDMLLVGGGARCRSELLLDAETFEACARLVVAKSHAHRDLMDILFAKDLGFALAHLLLQKPASAVIRYDGVVIPHCLLPVPLGDLKEEPLQAIWDRMKGDYLADDRLIHFLRGLEVSVTPELRLARTFHSSIEAERVFH